MPVKPKIVTLTNSSADILNAIRNSASVDYRKYVPVATNDPEVIRKIGSIIMDMPMLQNEFLSALVNRIGKVLLTSKLYSNPWATFKRGLLEFGETVEEIFVDLAKPFEYDPAVAESNVFKREIPDVKSAFHVLNYQKFYKATIQQNDLRKAFLNANGVTELVGKIVDAMYSGANYDEFLTMKYLLAKHILDGHLYPEALADATDYSDVAATFKGVSNDLEFMDTKYNIVGVHNFTMKENQHLIINSKYDAKMDVNVLATAFNMSKAEFMGHRHLIDGFGKLDKERLAILFADDPTYVPLTDAELAILEDIPAVLVDEQFFMIFDNLFEFTEQYNGEGLYWNYFYHTWKIFSVSPFANAIVFATGAPSITSVTVTPATATVSAGATVHAEAVVVTANFAPQSVTWESSDEDVATVDGAGNIKVNPEASASDTATITATSTFDSTKSDTCVITVA